MPLDIFGNKLYIGDVVVFADKRVDEKVVGLDVYEVVENVSDNTIKGKLLSGSYAGNFFYLQDTNERCSLIRNVYKTAELHDFATIN
jgi:hypothetical protein